MWGPGPFYTDYEPYADAPEGNHLVQYFDKGRLEINDPKADPSSPWYVTSGLLVKEMVAGKAQVGNGEWYNLGPANVPVAGDTDAEGVATYAHFSGADRPCTQPGGQTYSDCLLPTARWTCGRVNGRSKRAHQHYPR